MDKIRDVSRLQQIIQLIEQAKENLSPDLLVVILGPTASGKTALATALARQVSGEIISADSRQVYKGMDIGTGKDLQEYKDVPYHLIDIKLPGDKYNVKQFQNDFFCAYDEIIRTGNQPILCGGTGSYIQTILQERPYSNIPIDHAVQKSLSLLSKEELQAQIQNIGVPDDFQIDFNHHKRLVRALEILVYIKQNPEAIQPQRVIRNYLVFGLCPPLEERRAAIRHRLQNRLDQGLITEVENLMKSGITAEDLIYYGLEYKYVTYYLQGKLTYDELRDKLYTEINRYAKRQMTYFRKMEKDGIPIHWL